MGLSLAGESRVGEWRGEGAEVGSHVGLSSASLRTNRGATSEAVARWRSRRIRELSVPWRRLKGVPMALLVLEWFHEVVIPIVSSVAAIDDASIAPISRVIGTRMAGGGLERPGQRP